MARAVTEAERMRAHREAFQLAQQLRCTPKEAEAVLAGRRAHERWVETDRRLRAKMDAPPRPRISGELCEQPNQPWMMRD